MKSEDSSQIEQHLVVVLVWWQLLLLALGGFNLG